MSDENKVLTTGLLDGLVIEDPTAEELRDALTMILDHSPDFTPE